MNGGYSNNLGRVLPPGVHFKELARVEENIMQTGVPLFVGGGVTNDPQACEYAAIGNLAVYRIHNFNHFEQCFRVRNPQGVLDYAVRGFFENGGKECRVFLTPDSEDDETCYREVGMLFDAKANKSPLADVTDVDLVCIPDIVTRVHPGAQLALLNVQNHVLKYCMELEDRFALLDGPAILPRIPVEQSSSSTFPAQQPARLHHRLSELEKRGREIEGAMYFPWISVSPMARHQGRGHVPVPPCGHVAGIYARSDALYGVHKAPANEIIEGAVDLTYHVTDTEHGELNEAGINCLRSFPRRGIRVWGARTLSTQLQWRFVNIRRIFITLRRWIERNMADISFETHEPSLWDTVVDRIGAYCFELYDRGALKGTRPAEAFFVKCDAETNPPESREAGRLICEIGLAPVAPAEFIILRIIHSSASTRGTVLTAS